MINEQETPENKIENSEDGVGEETAVSSPTTPAEPTQPDEATAEAPASEADAAPAAAVEQADETENETVEEPAPEPLPKRKNLSSRAVQLVKNFAACGRCSYFLAGYRVLQGEDGLETVVSNQNDAPHLSLVWGHPMRDLVAKSFGVRFDGTYLHLSGSCPECGRPFTYQQDDNEPPSEQFKIEYRLKDKSKKR